MARIIGEVRPSIAFVENSPLLVHRGLAVVLGDLASLGYDARWGIVGATLAPLTSETESGFWPTPTATLGTKGGRVTPRKSKEGGTLIEAVRNRIPTPSTNDWKGSSKPGQRRGQLTDPAMGVIPSGGQLNPTWVEWLMGWPIEWTALEPSEMGRFQQWLDSHGEH
jgi:hypothetical protein